MGKLGTITRRTFFIGSAALAGGVAFGTYLVKRPIPNPLLDDLAEGEAAITPFIKINAEGINLITPRADKGQGAYNIQAHLVAEELDIDPASATISPGMPGPAYYNSTVLNEGVPFPAYDESALADVGTVLDPTNIEAQLFGGLIYGLGHAINSELTYENYTPKQRNYNRYEGLRLFQTPEIQVKVLENNKHIRGVGEPGLPHAAPALANAIFAATGKRIRELPLNKHIDFV